MDGALRALSWRANAARLDSGTPGIDGLLFSLSDNIYRSRSPEFEPSDPFGVSGAQFKKEALKDDPNAALSVGDEQ
jgi:hypothetical protein